MNAPARRAPVASRSFLLTALALTLAACGAVQVGTDVEFPKPLVDELPMTVGVYYSEDFIKYQHAEQRWGTEWKIELGKFHVRMGDRLFDSAFRDTVPVKSLSDLPGAKALRAVIEPRIEQYSFITPRDTGAKYYAVTIRYRLNVFAPDGRLADSLTFTGYGSSPSSGMTSTNPMVLATKAAMRDAAAKFLVQFPEQPVAKKMIAELPLIEEPAAAVAGANVPAAPVAGDDVAIESVPIVDTQPGTTGGSAPAAGKTEGAGGTTPPPPPPAPPTDSQQPGSTPSTTPVPSGTPTPPGTSAPGTAAPPATTTPSGGPPPEKRTPPPPPPTDAQPLMKAQTAGSVTKADSSE